ncbi:M48 family metallopeptidase [Rhodoferax sp.]|uniref:M48 family metallopeptidase n=1 Tax=Rhodoferax sp. TaxID=50421 RepID=UPI002743E15B|nr:SprT family zinc-dependent metalloprotease [Rhodoferax sp.]
MRSLLRYTLDLFDPQPAGEPLTAALPSTRFRHPKANRESRLGEAVVAYEFKRGKRRTIGFSVGPEGLVVSAPRWVPLHEVEAALQEKADWIVRKLDDTRKHQALRERSRIEWKDGACLPFMGESIQLVLDPTHSFDGVGAQLVRQAMGVHDANAPPLPPQLRVALPHSAAPQQIRDAVQAWLMRQAKANFTERLDHFAPKVQVQWRRLSLSNAGTRWGSARIDGSIRLNWRLVHFTQAVIDYVVVHELSHLRVMDHSPRFWETVGAVVPDYPALRNALKDHAAPRWD